MVNRIQKTYNGLVYAFVAAAMLCCMFFAGRAFAESSSEQSQKQADQILQEIEQSTKAYQDATATVDDLANQIAESEDRISQIEQEIPAQRDVTAASIKRLYIFQQSSPSLLELMLSADDFYDFITALEYLNAIHDYNSTQVNELQSMYDDLTYSKATLSAELDAAQQKQDEAFKALDTIRNSMADLRKQSKTPQNKEPSKEAQAAAQALEEANKVVSTLPEPVAEAVSQPTESELEEERRQNAENDREDAGDSQEFLIIETPDGEQITDEETDAWAARIDAYLSSYGAPLAGYGSVFAQAAAEYGVDPRIAPAIAVIESGGGKVCFQPHNAWGWGTSGWADWDSAIRGYISGFSDLYGSTLTPEGAEAYASIDEWATWYSLLHSEMASI